MANSPPPPGTADIFPEESRRWRQLEQTAVRVFGYYNYEELRTPIFENTEIFQRGIGVETEVVQKEMYTFHDRGGRSLTLRPEGTAGIMRALLNTDVLNGTEQRVFYYGPMFRGERPAAGRRRQFHQIGVENAGRVSPELDAECIAMLMHFLDEIGVTGAELRLNTRGIAADQESAATLLRNFFSSHLDSLCQDCRIRFSQNIWRILDCKQDDCKQIAACAPNYHSCFTPDSLSYFDRVRQSLDMLNIPFRIDRQLVRGLDYYVHTVFEVTHPALGAQTAVAGGGRYDLLLPGQSKAIHGVGFAAGIERLMLTQDAVGVVAQNDKRRPVYVASLGERARMENFKLANDLRHAGIPVIMEMEDKSMRSQMRSANRFHSPWVIIRGDEELMRGTAIIKSMDGQQEQSVHPVDDILDRMDALLNGN